MILARFGELRHYSGMNGKLIAIIAIVSLILIGSNTTWYFYSQNLKEKRDQYKTERNTARDDLKKCEASKKITEDVSNGYQEKLTALNRRYADLQRVRGNPKCIPIIPRAAR